MKRGFLIFAAMAASAILGYRLGWGSKVYSMQIVSQHVAEPANSQRILPEGRAPLPDSVENERHRRLTRGARISSINELQRKIENAGLERLLSIHQELKRDDLTGRENFIERQLVLYRIGEEEKGAAVRRFFQMDADRSENVYAVVLEGWAHVEPSAALEWWSALPAGNLRDSLLSSMAQGYLSGEGTSWEGLIGVLSNKEFDTFAMPLFRHIIDKDGLMSAVTMFEEHYKGHEWNSARNNVAVLLNTKVSAATDEKVIRAWVQAMGVAAPHLSADRVKETLRALGVAGGMDAVEWCRKSAANLLGESQSGVIISAWVDARSRDAAVWLEANPESEFASMVAFRLAIPYTKENPEIARKWGDYISDDGMKENLEAILFHYEQNEKK